MNTLKAISPIDGRYRNKTESLSNYFSEESFMKYRIKVEIEYFIALCEIPIPQIKSIDRNIFENLRKIYRNFSEKDALEIKEIENVTNHDIKAVEYFIKKKFDDINISEYKEFIHFGLTSQDINNAALPLSLKDFMYDIFYVILEELEEKIYNLETECKNIPLLARTHGQPASPTNLGKEIRVFSKRIKEQINYLKIIPYSAKFGGATGNFNAHKVAYPSYDWNTFANIFIEEELGLKRSFPTTQIEHYDNMANLFDSVKRINVILIDFCRDIWAYISMEYFKQKINKNEVGSSAMPHKVNPIDFENAEGNLGIANAIFIHLSEKLPISRLQRDLTDSTVLRNIGVPFAHTVISFKSIIKGLDKLIVNEEKIKADLDKNWVVVAEAIQTILRREKYPNPYETLKNLTRINNEITKDTIHSFIDTLDIDNNIKNELKNITPYNYTGIF